MDRRSGANKTMKCHRNVARWANFKDLFWWYMELSLNIQLCILKQQYMKENIKYNRLHSKCEKTTMFTSPHHDEGLQQRKVSRPLRGSRFILFTQIKFRFKCGHCTGSDKWEPESKSENVTSMSGPSSRLADSSMVGPLHHIRPTSGF